MQRLIELIKLVMAYVPLLRDNFSTESSGIDTNGFDGAMFVVEVGVTDITVDFKVQESDNDSDYTDVSGAAITQLSGTDDNKYAVVDVTLVPGSRKRYLRGVLVVGDGTNGANTSVPCLLYRADARPTVSGAEEVVKV